VKQRLVGMRQELERPWRAWQYRPVIAMDRQGDTVIVRHGSQWQGYALVKAVWAYEPGLAEKVDGPDRAKLVLSFPLERAALEGLVAEQAAAPAEAARPPLADIVNQRFTTECILYELLLPRAPTAALMLPRSQQLRLIDYLQRFH
jgi:hypothetical protein